MGVAISVQEYLSDHGIRFDTLNHAYTETATQSAVSAGIPMQQMVKAVLLEDHEGKRILAILPSLNKIRLKWLSQYMHRDFHLMPEYQLTRLFEDCKAGAIPALGEAYNLEVIYDELLEKQSDIYFEGGDHRALVHLDNQSFMNIMGGKPHCRFSGRPFTDYHQRQALFHHS